MNKTEQLLKQAVEASIPNLLDAILDAPVTPMTEPDFIVRQEKPSKENGIKQRILDWYSHIALRPALSLALCFILVFLISSGIFVNTNYVKADSFVSIDVNPSIELTTNKQNQVISVNAKNKDAKNILDGMNLIHVDLNIAVNAIIGSMLKQGYLQDDNNIILVSVSNKKKDKAKQIQDEIENDFSTSLKVINKQATVIKQDIKKDSSLEEVAAEYSISVGKLQLINQIIDTDSAWDIETLSSMNMEELALLAYEYGILLDGFEPTDSTITEDEEENMDTTEETETDTVKPPSKNPNHSSHSNSNVDTDNNASDLPVEDETKSWEDDEESDLPSKSTVSEEIDSSSSTSELPGKLNGNETYDLDSEEE